VGPTRFKYGDVNMENEVCSLLYLNNATHSVLLINVRDVGDKDLSRTYFFLAYFLRNGKLGLF
jgi:hypothetical protein